jgi:hypothetical protein
MNPNGRNDLVGSLYNIIKPLEDEEEKVNTPNGNYEEGPALTPQFP